jgi:pimeloyl-ACP methyl ester carboxylesterase
MQRLSISKLFFNYLFKQSYNIIKKDRAEFGTIPPVMIAHSVSSFIAQKYLESYALKGLVLVNPVPPVPGKVVKPLINLYEKCEEKFNLIPPANNEEITSLVTQCYYNLDSQGLESVPFPLNFMNSLMEPKAKLSLEGGTYVRILTLLLFYLGLTYFLFLFIIFCTQLCLSLLLKF